MQSNDALNFKKRILSMKELPTLPTIAMEVLKLAKNPDAPMNSLVRIIQTDPSMTSKILKISNSSFYGMRSKINTINRAIVILGMNEIVNLVTSISILKVFSDSEDSMLFNKEKFWEHCAIVGEIAKSISYKLKLSFYSEIFTAGLLHDIGKILLEQLFHAKFLQALEVAELEEISSFDAEKRVFGVAHSQVGGWVGDEWKLPAIITDAIYHHHNPIRALKNPISTAIINVADFIANKIANNDDTLLTEEIKGWNIVKQRVPAANNINLDDFYEEISQQLEGGAEFLSILK